MASSNSNARTKKVITVHGINTRGEWQEQIKAVLEPHFQCVSIKYKTYRRLGETKIVVDPIVCVVGVVMSLYFRHRAVSLALCLIATLLAAMLLSYWRRMQTLRAVRVDFNDHLSTGKAPHVIAHSLGTYFLGRLIAQFPDTRVDNLVLTGCVLRRSTPWGEYLKINPKAVRRVRNEMAGKDLVAYLAVIVYGFFPGLGHAGIVGFTDSSHDVDPYSDCGSECTALVHNVRLKGLGHSDVFVGRGTLSDSGCLFSGGWTLEIMKSSWKCAFSPMNAKGRMTSRGSESSRTNYEIVAGGGLITLPSTITLESKSIVSLRGGVFALCARDAAA